MDEFLTDINTSIFKEWLLFQSLDDIKMELSKKDNQVIYLDTLYGHGEIAFFSLNIIQLSVQNTYNNETEFFLHFQMNSLKHAIELFEEMVECLKKLVFKPAVKILLCCSGGLTTSYFASKIKDANDLLDLNYKFEAVGYHKVFDIGNEYDVIMLAPQVSFNYAKMKNIFRDKAIVKIPSIVFAKYDVREMLRLIEKVLQKKRNIQSEEQLIHNFEIPSHKKDKILSVSLYRNKSRIHIAYCLYDENNEVLMGNEIIKNTIQIQDIYDVLDTVFLQYSDIEYVGFSTPGIIINNKVVNSLHIKGLESLDFDNLFQKKYQKKFIVGNDVNTAVVGYFASQNQYSSMTLLFQPTGAYAGAGTIINGKLVKGYQNVAGEVQFLPLGLSDDVLILNKTPEGMLELVSHTITSIISIIGPEAILLSCSLIYDIDELKQEIYKLIPKDYVPNIIKIEDIQKYIILGQMILCALEIPD